jgi:TonB family protein
MIISKVQPVYPAVARAARIEGVVVLKAVIDKDGNIQDLTVASGSPMLRQAAIDAVSQWHCRPYLLNGQPVEVDTTVDVIFQIGQQQQNHSTISLPDCPHSLRILPRFQHAQSRGLSPRGCYG